MEEFAENKKMDKSDITLRIAKIEDAPNLLKIYSYYVQNTAISFE